MTKKLSKDELYKSFWDDYRPGQNRKLPVNCVVLAMPESQALGEAFVDVGVGHVLTFAFKKDIDRDSSVFNQLLANRYNYIYTFVTAFYIGLVQEKTVIAAY